MKDCFREDNLHSSYYVTDVVADKIFDKALSAGDIMTYDEGVRIACRTIAVYFLFWVASDILGIPHEVATVKHYIQEVNFPHKASPGPLEDLPIYYLRSSVLTLCENVLKIALWSVGALCFYRPGPWLLRFFAYRAESAAVDGRINSQREGSQ